jgi:hypothetical protein
MNRQMKEYLVNKCNPLLDKKGAIITALTNPTYQEEVLKADCEGWLSQANHLLHTGLTTDQYLEFDSAIAAVETDRGGSTMTVGYGNLAESRAAKQRARNTRLSNASMSTIHNGAIASSGGGLVTAAAAAQEDTASAISS